MSSELPARSQDAVAEANESSLAVEGETHVHLLRCVDRRVKSTYGSKCLARAEKEASESHPHFLREPDFNGNENSEVGGNASAIANGAAPANGPGAYRLNSGAKHLRRDDGVGVNKDEQIALRLFRTGIASRGNLTVLD